MIKSAFFNIDQENIILFFSKKSSYTDNQEEQIQENNLQNKMKKDRGYKFEKEKEQEKNELESYDTCNSGSVFFTCI